MQKFVLSLLRFYQKYLSADTGVLFPRQSVCRFSPTCSEYSYQAISKYGILHGSFLTVKRLFRCHPGHVGGYDPLV